MSEDPAKSLTQLWSRGTLQFEIREEQTDTVHDFNDNQRQTVIKYISVWIWITESELHWNMYLEEKKMAVQL